MEEVKNNDNKTNEKEESWSKLLLGCFIQILIWTAIISFLRFIFSYQHELTPKEIAQINAQKKAEFIKFENQVLSVPKQCDADYSKAIKSITSPYYGNAATNFNNAHYTCLEAFNQIQKIEIPDNLGGEQTKMLKSAMEDLTGAYALKNGASQAAYKFLTSGDADSMNKAKEKITYSQDYLLKGMLKIKQVKKELNILDKK